MSDTKTSLNRRKMALGLGLSPWLIHQMALAGGMENHRPLARPVSRTDQPRHIEIAPFALSEVRLENGPCRDAMLWNRRFLMQLDVERLLHNFRINAHLPSKAKPLGGWEAPDCELRGHFVGHYLSACALMSEGNGDAELKKRGDAVVRGLDACQKKLNQKGYLSAFPLSFFDRLDRGQKVWAPFYTIHKIMAGLLDMHVHAHNAEALQVVLAMAAWVDGWCAGKNRVHMQKILETEFGGMAEVLYNLAALTGNDRWRKTGDNFGKVSFLSPLTQHKDALKGLHANTHIPQAIAEARRYEIKNNNADHRVCAEFWHEVTETRSYVTGGTGNDEHWLTAPGHLGAEWGMKQNHAECCCAYNMMKLTRHLFSWGGEEKYMASYERLLFNHRLGTIEPKTGRSMYYLSLTPGTWKVFGTDDTSFWCCTGTGVEEYSKLNDSIFFHDQRGVYVNQYIASALDWRERKIRITQATQFPEEARTTLIIKATPGDDWTLHLRIPGWARQPKVSVNGKPWTKPLKPGQYLQILRTWKAGDKVTLDMPMPLHMEKFTDKPHVQALMAGPIVLAGQFPMNGAKAKPEVKNGVPRFANVRDWPLSIPRIKLGGKSLAAHIKPAKGLLTYTLETGGKPVTLKPLYVSFARYTVYWETV